MKEEYKNYISKLIKNYRLEHGYTLRQLAIKIGVDHSFLSKIERGIYLGHDDTIRCILNDLDIDCIFDEHILKEFDILFDSLFHDIVYVYDDKIKSDWEKIETSKDDILHSVYHYKYYVYYMWYLQKYRLDVDKGLIDRLLQYEDCLDIYTKQILYDNIGVYFVRIGEYDLAENYYLKAINLCNITLKFAMANEHIVRICCYRSMHLKAYNYSLQAIKVYEECNINNRLSNCNLILGNVCMYVKEYQEAIRVFKKGVELNDRNSLNCLNNLFLCYLETYDVDNIDELLKSIEAMYLSLLDDEFFSLIIRYAYLMNDRELFDKWYRHYTTNIHEHSLYTELIEFYRSLLYRIDLKSLNYKIDKMLKEIDTYAYEDEYVYLLEIKAKIHLLNKQYHQAADILGRLYSLRNKSAKILLDEKD